ncbi:ankyrin repeats (3 copies) domain-containing protein [Hirsutella rhossiliensis]|uniref:Ankyrin repeats (3 copies) domain-containing protein n=1 Tax=Hirsutella rhossiliensis TaxID=111463 RepID=A0A9P8SKW9_9HYPO|nr:ankyrin repeats (3 copies) domain-containing protein [Hirsutella rhossiliensis]KAH0965225.1 ankyrin repeats (3 copies) domain-containing protein [Hirsutella rhossiliensis]
MPYFASHVALHALALTLGFLQGAAAGGDDLSDFSNNLAQDLGPLLALFGEPVTRQYLSESTTFLDYFIFAVCPLGIITAVTAAVRVCGHPSLRAFIGRSQEGNGVVEAELCTSTSRDVCELFNNGGITRVLGQPNVLELVCAFPSNTSPSNAADAEGPKLFLFQDYLGRTDEGVSEWKKLRGSLVTSSESGPGSSNLFAPKPNLSLNVGIKRQPSWVFILVALTGLVLQVGIIVLAGFGAWRLGWNLNNPSNPSSMDYAPRMFIAGTALLCIGMCSCAALVGQATQEVTYKRRRTCSEQHSMLLWLQPGPQVVGDQSFDPFAHLENPSKPLDYWISSRKKKTGKTFELLTLVATAFTILGYVLQFIGLRGMKAWVSIAQLATTLFMGFLRGLLRMQRFGEGDNALAKMPDLVPGHELDWMAFEIALKAPPVQQSPSTPRTYRRFFDCFMSRLGGFQRGKDGNSRLHKMSPPASRNAPCWHITGQHAAAQAHSDKRSDSSSRHLIFTRARLAHLTGHFTFENLAEPEYQSWKDSLVRVRAKAKLLASAVGEAAKVMLQAWDRSKGKLPESISLRLKTSNGMGGVTFHEQEVHVAMKLVASSHWKVDSAQIEALLGLWMWSLLNDGRLTYADEAENMHSSAERRVEFMQIISASLDRESPERQTDAQDEMNLWLGPSGPTVSQSVLKMGGEEGCGYDDLWISSLVQATPRIGSLLDICATEVFSALLENRAITGLARAFVDSGLGTRSDVLLSVVPAFRNQVHPNGHAMLAGLVTGVDAYRRNGEWDRAQLLMRWACRQNFTSCGGVSEVVVRTGELYRWSLANGSNKEQKLFGLAGIGWMSGAFGTKALQPAFPLAVRNSWTEVAEAILELKGSLDSQDDEGRTAASHCAEAGLGWALERLIQQGAFLDQADRQGRTPLHWAAQAGNVSTVQTLILSGQVDCERQDSQGATPLWDALDRGHISVVEQLLAAGVDIESRQKDDHTPLTWTAHKGQLEMMKKLLEHGANVHQKSDRKRTAVHWAAAGGHTSCLQLLLEQGSDMHEPDRNYLTPINIAAESGHEGCLDALILHGADVNGGRGGYGRTPLESAASRGHCGVMRKLIQSGAEVNWRDSSAIELLLDNGAGINDTDDFNRTCLHWTMNKALGSPYVIKTLLKRGIDVNIASGSGKTGLHEAVFRGYEEAVAMLLSHDGVQVDVNKADKSGDTALLLAAKKGHVGIVRRLLDHGADVNLANNQGLTPLMYAADRNVDNDGTVAKLLLDKGADVNLVSRLGRTALTYAIKSYNDDIAQVFLERGAKGMEPTVVHERAKESE